MNKKAAKKIPSPTKTAAAKSKGHATVAQLSDAPALFDRVATITHQDIGQMDGYVRMYEDLYKVTGGNPTISLILCTEKSQTIARYSVLQENQQLFASKYRLHLHTEEKLAVELQREILAIQEGRMG